MMSICSFLLTPTFIIQPEFKESGLSQRKWCAIHDEDRNRLQYWILRFQYLELGSEIMFAEINVGGGRNDTDTPE